MVRDDAMMTVGDKPTVAKAKSTFSPATEFSAIEALEKRALKIWQRGYERASESIDRTMSDGMMRWLGGSAVPREAIAATRFCFCQNRHGIRL